MASSLITVLGGRGFIGSHLTRYLRHKGYDCRAPARGESAVFDEPLGHVIYAIGLTADFRSRPLDTVEAHVCFLRQLISSGNFESLTYLSSTRVYAGVSDTSETARLQVAPWAGGDLYNISKLMGESLCLHACAARAKVVRLSNIIGLRADPDIFIDQLLEEGYARGRIELRTSLDSKKDYLYIDDAVALLARIAVSNTTGIFNVASGEGVANGKIVRLLEDEMGFVVDVAREAAAWDFHDIDIAKIRDQFGFSPRPFAEYFPEFLKLYRQKKGNK